MDLFSFSVHKYSNLMNKKEIVQPKSPKSTKPSKKFTETIKAVLFDKEKMERDKHS